MSRVDFKKEKSFWESVCASCGDVSVLEGSRDAHLMFILEGCLSINLDAHGPFIVKKGQILLIPPHSKYRSECVEEVYYIICRFEADTLLAAECPVAELSSLCKTMEYEPKPLNINEMLFRFLSLMDDYMKHLEDDSFIFYDIKRKELFYLLFTRYPKEEIALFLHPLIGEDIKFQEFVLDNYMKVRSVEEFAEYAHYSVSGFVKKFRRYFNESPQQWMLRKKAEHIQVDIRSGLLTFQEIAYKYKFSSYRTFLAFCRAQFGLSPSEIAGKKY